MERIDPQNLSEQLTAFADGELDAAGNLAVLHYVAAHPDALAAVEEQQRLRLVARRVVRDSTPPVGDDLRRRIEAMAKSAPAPAGTLGRFNDAASPAAASAKRLAWRGPATWLAAAAAVLLLVTGGLIGRATVGRQVPALGGQTDAGSIVPASLVRSVTFTHVECSRLPADLHAATVAEIKPNLVAPLELDLHRDVPYPDLSSIGYELVGAGPCGHPVEDAVHLLYRSTNPAVRDSLSVFVRPFHADDPTEQTIQAGHLYEVVGPGDPHPLLAWRTGRLVYFLVGNGMDSVERARDAIRSEIRL